MGVFSNLDIKEELQSGLHTVDEAYRDPQKFCLLLVFSKGPRWYFCAFPSSIGWALSGLLHNLKALGIALFSIFWCLINKRIHFILYTFKFMSNITRCLVHNLRFMLNDPDIPHSRGYIVFINSFTIWSTWSSDFLQAVKPILPSCKEGLKSPWVWLIGQWGMTHNGMFVSFVWFAFWTTKLYHTAFLWVLSCVCVRALMAGPPSRVLFW